MEADLNAFLTQLEEIKETHPNIYHIWTKYIEIKLLSLQNVIDNGFIMLQNVKDISDLSEEQIIILYSFK